MTPEPIAIVGASAAGLYTAGLLAGAGRSVQVIEGASSIEPRPRTLIVTANLKDVVGNAVDSSIVNEVSNYELFTDGRVVSVRLNRPDLVIERSLLVRHLLQRAETSGAKLLMGRRFVKLEGDDHTARVVTVRPNGGGAETIAAQTIIGADGAFSAVARAAGWPQQPTAPLVQAIVKLPTHLKPDTARVWFLPGETPYFFWLIPESPSRAAVGLIGDDPRDIRLRLERFLERQRLLPLEFQAARIPLYTGWVPHHKRLYSADVYLVGDAAGHVKVTTVGGIVTGFRGAQAVAHAIENGGRSEQLRALRRELDLHLVMRKALHGFNQNDYSNLFDLLGVRGTRLIGKYTRDEAARVIFNVCMARPQLLLLGLRRWLLADFPRRSPHVQLN